MRSRIDLLNRSVLLTALLLAVLVAIASRLPDADGRTAAQVALSPTASPAGPAVEAEAGRATLSAPTPTPTPVPATPARTVVPDTPPPTALPTTTPTASRPSAKHIGILAGHWGYDSGAICADGLQEVDITTDIARRAAEQLRALGYTVEVLKEQEPDVPEAPLQNFQAAAFISLHADSCVASETTGFKVARWAFSTMPEVEDRLVDCIYAEYGRATGLPRHDDSITIDMWNYYAFREIAEATPGAILELGFMAGDRGLLVQRPDVVAEGVVNGLRCFLESPPEQ
jgi:N-acetylmuramoyl-L-alanine amidase